MNCRDVEPFLDHLSSSSSDKARPDEMALRAHVATCRACQQALQSLIRWNDQLSRAMNDIDIPKGMSERLLVAISHAASAGPISKPAVTNPIARNVWSRTLTTFIVAGLLSVAVWGTWHFLRPPVLSATDFVALLQQSGEDSTEAFQAIDNSDDRLPRQWMSLKGKIVTNGWKQVSLSNLRSNVATIPFEVPSKRGQPVEGLLFVIPKSRWTPTPAVPISQAPIQYAPPYAWVVWAEKDFVYILALNGPVPALEQFQRQLGGNQSVL